MKKLILLFLVINLLTSCSYSNSAIERAIAKTRNAIPTNTPTATATPTSTMTPTSTPTLTPTPLPLSQVQLENVLLLQGDLPAGYDAEPISRITTNPMIEGVLGYEQFGIQEFSKANEGIGVAAVFLFESIKKRDEAYNLVYTNVDEFFNSKKVSLNPPQKIGEDSAIYHTPVFGQVTVSVIVFYRCNAVVYMTKSMDDSNVTVLSSYAKKLDSRLTDLLCNTY